MLTALASAFAGDLVSGAASKLTDKLFGGGGTSWKDIDKQVAAQGRMLDLQEVYDGRTIQRRVEDAKKAGVSPMAALGMTPGSGFMGSVSPLRVDPSNGDSSEFGANVGRAISAAADPMNRLNMRLANAQIEGQELDNEYKRSQIMKQYAQVGPSMPGVAGGPTDNDYTTYALPDGSTMRAPGPDLGQMMENSPAHGAAVVFRDVLDRFRRIGSAYSKFKDAKRNYWQRKFDKYH